MSAVAYAALALAQKGLVISDSHIFADNAARDTYFATNTAEKATGVYISVGTGFQQWSGTAWVDKTAVIQGVKGDKGDAGAAGASTLGYGSVGIENVKSATAINLFNPAEQIDPNIIAGKYLGGGGAQFANANYFISSKIPVIVGATYTVSNINSAASVGGFYSSSDTWIANIATDTFTVPVNTSYIRLSVYNHVSNPWATTAMLVSGDTLPAGYVPFGAKISWLKIGNANLEKASVLSSTLADSAVQNYNITPGGVRMQNIAKVSNVNLFNAAEQVAPNIEDGKYLGVGGVVYTSGSYLISSKIPVVPGQTYTVSDFNNAATVAGCFYTSADVYVSDIAADTFTAPATAAYVRLSVYKSLMATGMLVIGSVLPTVFLPWGAEIDWLRLSVAQLTLAGNHWYGKKMNCIGDSITAGSETVGDSFPVLVGKYLGLSVVRNYGISGTTLGAGTGSVNPMTTRYLTMDDDADIITFSGGTNDVGLINNLGTYGDTVATSFFGALDVLIKGLIVKYPAKLVIGITPTQRSTAGVGSVLETYANALKQVCAKYCIPCLDAFHDFGMCPIITEQSTALFGDGLHPNAAGKIVQANKISGFIRTQ